MANIGSPGVQPSKEPQWDAEITENATNLEKALKNESTSKRIYNVVKYFFSGINTDLYEDDKVETAVSQISGTSLASFKEINKNSLTKSHLEGVEKKLGAIISSIRSSRKKVHGSVAKWLLENKLKELQNLLAQVQDEKVKRLSRETPQENPIEHQKNPVQHLVELSDEQPVPQPTEKIKSMKKKAVSWGTVSSTTQNAGNERALFDHYLQRLRNLRHSELPNLIKEREQLNEATLKIVEKAFADIDEEYNTILSKTFEISRMTNIEDLDQLLNQAKQYNRYINNIKDSIKQTSSDLMSGIKRELRLPENNLDNYFQSFNEAGLQAMIDRRKAQLR